MFMIAVKALSIAVLLYGPNTRVLSILIWKLWEEEGGIGITSALSVLLFLALVIIALISRRLTRAYRVETM